MKRYEKFNKLEKVNRNAEIQSFGMIIAQIQEKLLNGHSVHDITEFNDWEKRHRGQVEWLNEEV